MSPCCFLYCTDWKYSQRRAFLCSDPLSPLRLCLQTTKNSGTFYWSNVRKGMNAHSGINVRGLFLLFQSCFFLIFCSNQWRKSHTGDTDVCPETSADPRHVDPLTLPRPHARPAQGSATFFRTTADACCLPLWESLFPVNASPAVSLSIAGQKPQPLLHCFFPPQPPVCLSILHHDWILLQCWLSQQTPPFFTSLLFFFLTLVPKLVLLLLLLTRRHSNCCNPSARVNL